MNPTQWKNLKEFKNTPLMKRPFLPALKGLPVFAGLKYKPVRPYNVGPKARKREEWKMRKAQTKARRLAKKGVQICPPPL